MKRKSKSTAKAKVEEVKAQETKVKEVKKLDTAPLSDAPKFIKNVYSSIVKVRGKGSGRDYKFKPGQTLPVDSRDVHHLLSLKRDPGNCCGGETQARYYFELAE